MKSLQEFRNVVVEEEKQDFTKFDALVRAGLANKAQLQRLHQILGKMGEEHPSFSNADRAIIQNMFTKMVDLITNNPQIYRNARKAVSEEYEELEEAPVEMVDKVPPFVLLLKRQAIRLYPNNTRVALYYNQRLDKYFSIPFMGKEAEAGIINATEEVEELDEVQQIDEAVMDTLHKIVAGKSAKTVKFASGHTRRVDHWTASAITQVHKALNDVNKKKYADMVHKSPEHFSKASEFAFSKVK